MIILGIETTGAFASVALAEAPPAGKGNGNIGSETSEAKVIDVIHGNDRFSHLQNLTPQIRDILDRSDMRVGDLGAIAVSHGPGSFTGIRIGVSTARAMSQVTGIPCVAVSSLEALALRAVTEGVIMETTDGATLICPILDARRKQVYGAGYRIDLSRNGKDGNCLEEIIPAGSYLMTEFLGEIEGRGDGSPILFLGDGIDTCGEIIAGWSEDRGMGAVAFAGREHRYQDASTVALRGWQLFEAGMACGYMELDPEYLRMAEAEKKLREKLTAK